MVLVFPCGQERKQKKKLFSSRHSEKLPDRPLTASGERLWVAIYKGLIFWPRAKYTSSQQFEDEKGVLSACHDTNMAFSRGGQENQGLANECDTSRSLGKDDGFLSRKRKRVDLGGYRDKKSSCSVLYSVPHADRGGWEPGWNRLERQKGQLKSVSPEVAPSRIAVTSG